MGNIRKIYIALHKFTPTGQEMALNILKQNRSFLKSKEYAFAELPMILSNSGQLKPLEEQLVNPNNSIRDIIISLLKTKWHKIDTKKVSERATENLQRSINIRPNQIQIFENNFDKQKQTIAELLKNSEINSDILDLVIRTKTPEELANIVVKYKSFASQKIAELLTADKISMPQLEQIIKEMNDRYLCILKSTCQESNNANVLRIEKLLKEKCGMEFVSLHNEQDAINFLKTIRLIKQNNIPLPKNVIISPLIHQPENMLHSNGTRTILLHDYKSQELIDSILQDIPNSEYPVPRLLADILTSRSTNNDLHVSTHECVHSMFDDILNYAKTLRSNKSKSVALKTSDYNLQTGFLSEEARTEYKTKELLERLTPSQKRELDLLS